MPRHVKDIRKQHLGVSRGSCGHLQVDDLRDRSAKIEPGGVPFAILPCGDVGETGFLEQANDLEAPKLPPGEGEVPEDSSQGLTQEETDEAQSESEVEQDVEEQVPLRRSQRVRRRPRYLDQYGC